MVVLNVYYNGENGSAKRFVEEMEKSGIAPSVRAEEGNIAYAYFSALGDDETVILVEKWESQRALDTHQASPAMSQIVRLREKHGVTSKVERFSSEDMPESDGKFVRTK